jgi:hypothetical protein
MSWSLVLFATLTVASVVAEIEPSRHGTVVSVQQLARGWSDRRTQDRVVPPIYVPPEPDRGTPAGHGTFESRNYRVIQYRHHYSVTFSPGLPRDQPTVIRAMTMLCRVVAKFDVAGVVPHTTSPPRDDIWVFETRKGTCIGTVFRSTDPHSTVVSVERIDRASH